MTELLILAVILGGLAVAFGVGVRVGRRALAEAVGPSPAHPTIEPTPEPPPRPKPAQERPKGVPVVTLKLVNRQGKAVATKIIPASQRRIKFTYGLGIYQASHQDETGAWVYRLSEMERG